MDGPPNSGDLRFYEKWWKDLKQNVYENDPGPQETEKAFRARVIRTAKRMKPEVLWPPCLGQRNRILLCLGNGGGRFNK